MVQVEHQQFENLPHGFFEPQEKHDPGVSEDVYLGARVMLVLLSKTPIQTTIHILMVGTSI
jgi:hypothetical protein